MLIGKMGCFSIYRTGEEVANGGGGITWRCTCTRGEPVEYLDANGRKRKRRCRHVRAIWAAAKEGRIPHNLRLTVEGAEAAIACGCMLDADLSEEEREDTLGAIAAQQLAPAAPVPPTPPGERKGPSKGGPCPCGSGHKYKKCEGPDDGSAPHALFAFDDMPGFSAEEQERLKEARRAKSLRDAEERLSEAEAIAAERDEQERLARLARAERRAQEAERQQARIEEIDAILYGPTGIRTKDDEKKAKKAAYDAGRRVQRAAYDKARRAAKKAATSANG